jgi:hypothetical protein
MQPVLLRYRIRLDTFSEIRKFVKITSKLKGRIYVTDGGGLTANAKSLLNMIPTLKYEELWCESENDIYYHIKDFLID